MDDLQPNKLKQLSLGKFAVVMGTLAAVGWFYLFMAFPHAVAIASVILFGLLCGLFLCRVVLGVESPLGMAVLSPILGALCLFLFWILFQINR